MSKTFKRQIACITAIIVVLCSVYLPAGATTMDKGQFEMVALGLVEADETGAIAWDSGFTRAELAYRILKILGYEPYNLKYDFSDVTSDTAYSKYISGIAMLGIMNGNGNGEFRPDAYVTVPEAAKTFAVTLGYAHQMQGLSYPAGVLSFCAKLGLLNGIPVDGVLTNSGFASMLANAMDVELIDATFHSSGNQTFYKSGTLRESLFGQTGSKQFSGKGILEANEYAFIDAPYSGIDKGQIVVDGVLYYTNNRKSFDYLGMEVYYFGYTDEGGKHYITSVMPTKENQVISFEAENFISYSESARQIDYYEDVNRKKSATLSNVSSIVKNFDTVLIPTKELFNITSGNFTLIDNDHNGQIDVVIIESYEHALVDRIQEDMIVFNENFKINGGAALNLSEKSNKSYILRTVDGEIATIDMLGENSVISALSNRTKNKTAVVISDKAVVQGTVASINKDKITVGENTYKILVTAGTPEFNTEYDFYLNFKNEIVWFEKSTQENTEKYCYVSGVKEETFESTVKLITSKQVDFGTRYDDTDIDNTKTESTLICENGEIITVKLADKFFLNGTKSTAAALKATLNRGVCVFRYKLNAEGELTRLDVPEVRIVDSGLYIENGTLPNLRITYNLNDRMFGSGVAGMKRAFAIDEHTQVLCVDRDASDEDIMTRFRIDSKTAAIKSGFNALGYDYNPLTKKCGLLVISEDMNAETTEIARPAMTEKSFPSICVLNDKLTVVENDETRLILKFVEKDGEKELMVAKHNTDAVNSKVRVGDLFVYTTNLYDEISDVYDVENINNLTYELTGSNTDDDITYTYGDIIDIKYNEIDGYNNYLSTNLILDDSGYEKVYQVANRNLPPVYIWTRNGAEFAELKDIFIGDNTYIIRKASGKQYVIAIVIVR